MKIECQINVAGSAADVWNVISDIEHIGETVSAIENIEILERPVTDGLVGLTFRETRTMFGKSASEVMTVCEAVPLEFYTTTAESHGAVYTTTYSVAELGDHTVLKVEFESRPMSALVRVLAFVTGLLFNRATRKAFARDLADYRDAVEEV